ncbi:metal-dependent transcriptional regulator [uncultured Bifidobacterium sp.]|uniref:metal-dependent transcriptional regulator n=1 Tax=uncultured Bifidobacterium sp. TaxID=165187 RepID=UPI00262C37BE|nr:metal-dependent transcriptional regulator [uncultured Bifidobacterium sp.]
MSLHNLSANAQDYLKVLWDLREWTGESVAPSELAKRAGVKLSTVSGAVSRLVSGGYATHTPYGTIELTAEGESYALVMVRRHRLLETFLVRTLGYRWDEVHHEADALEHAASDMMIDRIDELLGHPETDPHGDPIPRADGTLPENHSIPLADAPQREVVRIDRVSDEDSGLLRYLDDQGIGIGSEVLIGARPPHSHTTTIIALFDASSREEMPLRDPIALDAAAGTQIRVTPIDINR